MRSKVPFLKSIAEGSCTIGFSSPQLNRGFRGGGNLAILVFDAVAQGETRIMRDLGFRQQPDRPGHQLHVPGIACGRPLGRVIIHPPQVPEILESLTWL